MSSPPLKTPAPVRWLSLLVVLVALIVYLWPHGRGTAPAPAGAPAATRTAQPVHAEPTATAAPAREGWGDAVGFRTRDRLLEHFEKHGREFRAASAEQYLRMAQALRDRPVGGDVLELVRDDGVTSRFDRASGAFIAFGSDGVIRTFFRPNDGERYFERQAGRPH